MRCDYCGKRPALCECCPEWDQCTGWRQLAPGHWRRCRLVHSPTPKPAPTPSALAFEVLDWISKRP